MFHLEVLHNEQRDRPHIQIVANYAKASGDQLEPLDVRPLLFEYLLRVADGSLPSSFSRQCHQEVKHFTTMLRQRIARMLDVEVPSLDRVQMLSLDNEANISSNPIKVNLP